VEDEGDGAISMEADDTQVPFDARADAFDERPALRRLLSLTDESQYSSGFMMYFRSVKRARFWIVAFWLVMMTWGLCTGFRYISEGRDEMNPPKGSRAWKDAQVFSKRFLRQSTTAPLIVYISCHDDIEDCTVACPAGVCGSSKSCSKFHNKEIAQISQDLKKRILDYSTEKGIGYRDEVLGFYIMDGTSLDKVKCQFTSPSGRATFLVFEGSTKVESKIRYDMVREVNEVILPELNPDPSKYYIGTTGTDPIFRDGSTAAVKQSEMIDAATMPFAFALLAYMVRSWRLLLISLLNMGIALFTAFGVLVVLTDTIGQPPMTTTASFVEVLGLAMNTDYALFMLRRLRDETKNGRHPEMGIKIMMSQAGHVVMMSSLTIICVFGGFIFMKSTDLQVQGMACVTIVSLCLLVNMTNTPALLLIAPHFFTQFPYDSNDKPTLIVEGERDSCWSRFKNCICCGRKQKSVVEIDTEGLLHESLLDEEDAFGSVDHQESSIAQYLTSPTAVNKKLRGGPYKGWYLKLLLFVTRWPRNLVTMGLIYLAVIPLALQALRIDRNCNLIQAIPRDSNAGQVYKDMLRDFPGGTLLPLFVIADGPQDRDNSILENSVGHEFFRQLQEVQEQIAEAAGMPIESLSSVALAQGRKVVFTEAKILLNPRSFVCRFISSSFCDLYQFEWEQGVNERNTSAMITIIPPFDPFKNGNIEKFIRTTYDVIDNYPKDSGPLQGLYFSGLQVGMIEDMRISFSEFPLLVGITCAVVFVLLGVMLRSAFVVLRLTITVVLPVASVFGMSVLVYQDGILNWTGIPQLSSSSDGFFWYVPLLSFTVCVGLALDYDTLCIARVKEHRKSGMEIRAAILRGIWEISTTVVCAGTIMAIAFAGLLTSSTLVVNQISFILTLSVLVDSFIVQCIVMPCILSFADDWAWFPDKVPKHNLVTLEEEIHSRNKHFFQTRTDSASSTSTSN